MAQEDCFGILEGRIGNAKMGLNRESNTGESIGDPHLEEA
jgi:hypothetical protein